MKNTSTLGDSPVAVQHEVRPLWRIFSTLTVWLLIVYLGIVSPLDTVFPAINHLFGASFFLILSIVATYALIGQIVLRASNAEELTKNITLLAAVLLLSLLTADVAFTVFSNVDPTFRVDQQRIFSTRQFDKSIWDGELEPARYFPTDANFWLYKPGQVRSASVYGEHYYTALTQHKLLQHSVLKSRKVDSFIDRFGLRNIDEASRSRIFALGDSFCFGYSTSQQATFTVLLKSKLGGANL